MINYIENENDNVKQTIYFNRPRRRNGHQYTKYNMSRLDDVYMSQVTSEAQFVKKVMQH